MTDARAAALTIPLTPVSTQRRPLRHLAKCSHGGSTAATPEAARMAVVVGCQATASLRNGGGALDVPPMRENLKR